jgi:glycosyltransferase involved in cell wall biosynthesis
MKICLLHYAAPPVVGGVESVIGHHARLMVEDGFEVTILAGRGAQVDARIPFIELPLLDSRHPEVLEVKAELDSGRVSPRFDRLIAALVELLQAQLTGADILIAHNVCSLNKNLPLTAALKQISEQPGAPHLILWHHDLAWTTPRYRAELHDGYPWDLLRGDWPGATQVTISTPRQKELADLLHVPEERIAVIPNGIDVDKFLKLEPQTVKLVNRLNLLAASPLILLPVRITPRKNIELAVRALAELRADYPDAILVITGPLGPHNPANLSYFNQLSTLRAELGLEKAVVFLAEQIEGYLPDEIIADFYRLADVLLFPSREEGFGILEAGLAGLPVFCADIPPLRDLGGRFVEYFSPDCPPGQVAGVIQMRLANDSVFNLRQQVKRSYTWGNIYHHRIRPLLGK